MDCPKTQIQKGLELQLAASLDHTQTEVTTKDCHNLKNSGARGLRPGAQKQNLKTLYYLKNFLGRIGVGFEVEFEVG